MRLTTFNVLHGRSPADGSVDVARFAAAVAELDADVLALQEVDRDQPRSHGADLTAVAAQAGGAVAHRFAAALSGLPGAWAPATGGEPPGTPLYGVALLSRYPVLDSGVVRLPALPVRVPLLVPGRKVVLATDEPRVAVTARLDAPGGPVTVVSTHLSFVPGWNVVQLRRLLRALPRGEPLVVLGDLNMRPPLAARASGLRRLATGATFPAHAPSAQIDHILARGDVAAAGPAFVSRLAVSDHCALTVDVERAAG
jgi:endonuclease/exonuclease/phosphatase family metal-dependent hydrolase